MNTGEWTRARANLALHQCPPVLVVYATPACPGRLEDVGFLCTRRPGHTGRHYAHHSGRIVAVWR